MRRLVSIVSAVLICNSAPAASQVVVAPGAMNVDGFPVACGPAPTILTGQELGDLAKGGPAGIFLNWPSLSNYPTGVKLFVYAHECSHVLYGGDENLADRFAINLGRDQGWINASILNQICQSVFMSGGDWTHLPGPVRCQKMLDYFMYG